MQPTASDDRATGQAHERGGVPARSAVLKQRTESPLFYALADLATGRAVLDSQFLRNSSRCLSTKALASSKLA